MLAWRRSGVAVRLLAVFCVAVGCAAAQQQQQQPSAVFSTTPDELLRFIEQAVRVELQPLVSKLESRVEALDNRLVKLDSRVDELTVRLFDNSQSPQQNELSSRLNTQQSQLDELVTKVDSQNSQVDELVAKVNSQHSKLESLTSRLISQESQVSRLATQQDSQQYQLALLTNVSLDQVEGEGELGGRKALPHDCSELPAGADSGVYLLQVDMEQVQAYCDMETDGGKWTVFQRRADIEPRQDFYLGWGKYREGFGDLRGEFWWGLAKLWRMTSAKDREYQLRIDLEAFDGEKTHALYEGFLVSPEEDGFRLSVSGYSGDAGDGLRNNSKFYTRDRDLFGWHRTGCAQQSEGAWWYGPRCSISDLNGPYRDGPDDDSGTWNGRRVTCLAWHVWKGGPTLKKTDMKIRRV